MKDQTIFLCADSRILSRCTSFCHMCSHAVTLSAHHCYMDVNYIRDSESAQTYGPPEWMQPTTVNLVLVLKDCFGFFEPRPGGGGRKQARVEDILFS